MPVNDDSSSDSTILTICMGQEPGTLYLYGGSLLAQTSVMQAVYDGPIDNRSFDYQAVILEKLPSLADGDAIIQAVNVTAGDTVVDESGTVVTLAAGVRVRPAGCDSSDCVVEYVGGTLNMDQMVVTFKMKSGLTWSDGVPLTASDSVYSFGLHRDPDTPLPRLPSKNTGERTDSYTAEDNLTTKWVGLPGFKDSTYYTNFFSPLPQHIYGQYTAAQLVTADVSARKPLGWGPYVIDDWKSGDRITLHKNANYFRASDGLPRFDNLVIKFVGENSSDNIDALLTGECDIVDQTAHLDDQSELLLQLVDSGELKADFVTGTVWEHVDFGIQHVSYDDGYDGGLSDRPDFFSDVRTRRAFAYCMERQKVVDAVMFGQSAVIDTYLPPEHPLFNPNVRSYKFDPGAGKTLLAQVGWVDMDGDGIREAHGVQGVPDGTRLEVSYGTTTATQRQQATQILAQSLSECGIKVNLNYYPSTEWFADNGVLFGRRFDLGQFAWLTSIEPPCDLYLSSNVTAPSGSWIPIMEPTAGSLPSYGGVGDNEVGYYNSTYDSVCKAALGSLEGEPSYAANHLEAQRIFAEDMPVIPLYLRLKLAVTRPDVTGLIIDPTENSEFWNIEDFGRYIISGRVYDSSGKGVQGATIQVGSEVSLSTDANGIYTFTTVIAGNYTLMPSLPDMSGYTLYPTSRTVSTPPTIENADFVAAIEEGTIEASNPQNLDFTSGDIPVSVQVPMNAVNETTTLLYSPAEVVDEIGYSGFSFGLTAFRDGEVLEDFSFETPITVQIDYDDADVSGLDEDNLRLLYWTGSTWDDAACGSYNRHPEENWLSVPICHLSQFGLFDRWELFIPISIRFVY
jgi:peptide/nickel transport system substrate-binding protein